jgi:ER lumen protein retaining receptor
MKLIFIGSSLWIIYYMRVHRVIKQTYDASEDTFRVLFLVAPSAVLALLINQKHNSPVEVRRAHRLALPASTVLPQI